MFQGMHSDHGMHPQGGTGDTPKADPTWQAAAEDWIYVLGPEDRLVDPQGRAPTFNGMALVFRGGVTRIDIMPWAPATPSVTDCNCGK